MIDALNRALEIFCFHSEATINEVITNGLFPIADAMDVNRIVVYRCIENEGETRLKQMYRWVKTEGGLTDLSLDLLPDTRTIAGWLEILQQDLCVNRRLCDMSDDEISFMDIFGIKSVLMAPIFTLGEFWGCIFFQNHISERLIDEDCMDVTRSFAYLCANAIIRAEMEYEAAERHELNRVMFNAAPIGLTTFDGNFSLIDCNDSMSTLFSVTKEYFIDHFYELSPEYQPDGAKSSEKMLEIMKWVLAGEKLTMEWVFCSSTGEPIPCEITGTRMRHKGKYIGLGYVYDLRHIKKMEESIKWLESEATKAYYDPLTGIYNRRHFDENLSRLMKTLSRSGSMLSLMMIDVDYFKKYNDTYGHSAGDNCLKIIADTISKSITRADDFAARYGGEEFAVVLPNTDENGACVIADKLLENIRKCGIPHEKNDAADCVTISIGVTTGKVTGSHSEDDYIKSADEMLYKSKQNGRNRYSFTTIKETNLLLL